MMKFLPLIFVLPILAHAELVEETVLYEQDGTTLEGFQVHDDSVEGTRPGILVVHQWTGLTDYEKKRSRMLAELGYNVLAVDVYGQGIRPQPPEAGAEAGKYKNDRELFRARLQAGLKVLQEAELTDTSRIAAIGYCFGGTGVLELARAGADIRGVVSFHGGLGAAEGMEARPDTVNARVLVCHGAEDPYAPLEEVTGFWKEMNEAGADWQLVTYPNAVHSFTQPMAGDDPSKGAAYDAAADELSWRDMRDFFDRVLK